MEFKPTGKVFEMYTMRGYSAEQVYHILAMPLPPDCYKGIQGSSFTDISSVARDVILTELFGPCGVGWAYEYDESQITIEPYMRKTKDGEKEWGRCIIPRVSVKFRWIIDNGTGGAGASWSEPIPMPGFSENMQLAYAPKGAITAAIGGAVSHLLFQQMVYQGKLDENKAAAAYTRYGPHPFEAQLKNAALEIAAERKVKEEEDEPPATTTVETPRGESKPEPTPTTPGPQAPDKATEDEAIVAWILEETGLSWPQAQEHLKKLFSGATFEKPSDVPQDPSKWVLHLKKAVVRATQRN